MSNTLLISLAVLGILGGVLAVVLYFVAQRFKVEENPLIDEAEACLPGANCGGCGSLWCAATVAARTRPPRCIMKALTSAPSPTRCMPAKAAARKAASA